VPTHRPTLNNDPGAALPAVLPRPLPSNVQFSPFLSRLHPSACLGLFCQMRALTNEESRSVFSVLSHYIVRPRSPFSVPIYDALNPSMRWHPTGRKSHPPHRSRWPAILFYAKWRSRLLPPRVDDEGGERGVGPG
jgi:hypothetical protein